MEIEPMMRVQYGLVTRADAMAGGLSERQIDRRLASGVWIRQHRGVYRHTVVPVTWESRLLGACLASGGIASHRSAAVLWDLDVASRSLPEITVARSHRRSLSGVRVHESTQWDRRAETIRHRIPVTGIERTLLDCGAVVTGRRLERLVEAAVRQKLTSWAELLQVLMRHSRRGRDGCGSLRLLLERRLGDQTVPLSDFSRLVVNLLVDNGIEPPLIEYRITARDGNFIMQTDLAWPERRKAWELDGLAFHLGRVERERDNRKRNRAKSEGWNIQEILWSMYVDDPQGLVETCRGFLEP